jgi:hypothetical protein
LIGEHAEIVTGGINLPTILTATRANAHDSDELEMNANLYSPSVHVR